MDFYMSLPFWCAFFLIVFLFRQAPERPTLRELLLLTSSVCMLLTLPRFGIVSLIVYAALSLVAYTAGTLLMRGRINDPVLRRAVAAASITVLISVLVFFKYRFVQEAFAGGKAHILYRGTDFISLLGISYAAFKAIHFVVDSYKDTIRSATLLSFLNYIFFFPSFISGPINRFNHFIENAALKTNMTQRSDFIPGVERIIHGLFKKTVLATLVFPYIITNVGIPFQQMQPSRVVLGLYAYAFYLYFDFSGYSDLAIGSARLMGFVLPENFDSPFLKRNIQQLWANWHISLTGWLTEYVYWPIVRRLRRHDTFRTHPLLLSNIAIVVTFVICGIWHGEGPNFIIWGLFHGLGIATVNVYQNWKRRVRDEGALRYFRSPLSHYAGVIATFNFFALGLSLFALDTRQIGSLAQRFFAIL